MRGPLLSGYVLTASALASLLALSASAVAAPDAKGAGKPANKACFYHSELSGFTAPDEHTLYVRVSVNDVYRIETFGPCMDLDWAMRIAIVDRGGGGWICVGDPADVVYRQSGIGEQRCPVKVAAHLTPDEVKALPKKSRP
jgi:hypothetical protein